MLVYANVIAIWYKDTFKRLRYGLIATNREEAVSVDELQSWLNASHKLASQSESEDARMQSTLMTTGMIDRVVRRTNVNLIRVSVLALFTPMLHEISA